MNKEAISAIAIFILGFGLVSRRLEKSVITPPMAYLAFGLLISSSALGLIQKVNITNEIIKILAEITLSVILFTDASRIQLKLLRREYSLPLRLLGVGLPLTIVFGTVFALLLFPTQLDLWSAAALATILSPTDAALGQAVVNSSRVPTSVRQAINVESGLNDGICLPILLLFVSLAGGESDSATYWLSFTTEQILFGIAVGLAIGYIGSKSMVKSLQRQWMNHSFEDLAVLGLSILAYTSAEIVGGNGFIAAFTAGLTVGFVGTESLLGCLHEFGEAEGQLLTLISFLLFGAVVVIPSITSADWQVWLYAISSLTVSRMLGVAIALKGLKLQLDSTLFIGWFGPRGIASIVYGLLIVDKGNLPGSQLMFTTMVVTVSISVFAHGLTAFPGVKWYANRISDKEHLHDRMPEMKSVTELAVRLPWRH